MRVIVKMIVMVIIRVIVKMMYINEDEGNVY